MELQIAQCPEVTISGTSQKERARKKKKVKKGIRRAYMLAPLGSVLSNFDGDEVFGVPTCCFDHV